MQALTFSRFGGPEVLEYIEVPDPVLPADAILVEMKAIGLNYADIYRRKGTYHLKGNPPYLAGYEGAGVVVDSNGHAAFPNGTRIGFADVPFANAQSVAVPVTHAIPLPEAISFETAAAVLLQGLTAHYLVSDSRKLKENEVAVVHTAAGGVGQFLTQMCKLRNAIVIGLTMTESKMPLIRELGADAVFRLNDTWKAEVMAFTNGKGVDVVYDSVGSTLTDSLDVTREGGQVVVYGMTGGRPASVDPFRLMSESKTLTGGDLWGYLTSSTERINRANELFGWIQAGQVTFKPPITFPLADGRSAHEFLESGKSAGKVLLIP